jgi:hypothetical protein
MPIAGISHQVQPPGNFLTPESRFLIPDRYDLERPACFIRSIRRQCGQASPTFQVSVSRCRQSGFRLTPNACFPIPDGDSARPVTFVTRSARIDLLFTMSDITRAPAKRTTRGLIFSRTNFGACGAVWWSQTGSNRRPPACKAGALPTELWPRQECGSRRRVSGQRILMPKTRLSIPGVGGPGKI